ncbi:MAG TPA: cobalt ECF transporter T component CbiQ [Stenomitos sp.]
MLLHINSLSLNVDQQPLGAHQRLLPATRILCALLLLVAIVATPNGEWLTWGLYGLVIVVTLLTCRVDLIIVSRRMAVESAFVGVIVLGTLFRPGADVVWEWGWLRVTETGLLILGSVVMKALLSLLLMNVLTLTTPVSALLHGLAVLRIPPLLVAIVAAMYRYLSVLTEEFDAMRRAALSRNLNMTKHWQRLVVGNMIGSLFIRTYERGERVHQAMLSRGYDGVPTAQEPLVLKRWDWFFLLLTGIFALLGQLLHWMS